MRRAGMQGGDASCGQRNYDHVVPCTRAVLVDVYETALHVDFTLHDVELPRAAGVPGEVWKRASTELAKEVTDGRTPLSQAFEAVIARSAEMRARGIKTALVSNCAEHTRGCWTTSS